MMGYWVLFVLACWIGFGVIAAPILPDDQRAFAFTSAIGALFVFAIVESIVKSLQQKKWTRRVAYAPARRELPPVKLSDSLLVDDQLRAFVGSVIDGEPAGAASETPADVKRLYEVLDE
jgi:hypothetical protein